jgi:hypothetical protein
MNCCEKNNEEIKEECCLGSHKDKIIPCLIGIITMNIIIASCICIHKHHKGVCYKKMMSGE